ncbi:MAG: radical SAM protein [Chloroflexi bacterium]|nr:radical SAM protein [Chloroflexota bacterium]
MLNLLPRVPLYWAFRRWGWPRPLPFSLVVSVSYRCNSRCATCAVWKKPSDELTLDEWTKVFARLGHTPTYLTFTGGEPFLRADFPEIVGAAYRHTRPTLITIPTNGLLTQRIVTQVEGICRAAPGAQIGLNLSLDSLGEDHDRIRGVPGNWERAMETWRGLKALQPRLPNLLLSIHTVISQENIDRFPEICQGLRALQPDSYITEVAEERVELGTVGWQITPSPQAYRPLADFLSQQAHAAHAPGLAALTQSLRARYYGLAAATLEQRRQVIPCYAGWASAQLAPDGDVWTCCVRAQAVGNLRKADYDLRRIWRASRGPLADLRRAIAWGECACPLANAAYANMLLNPGTALGVAGDALGRWLRKGR